VVNVVTMSKKRIYFDSEGSEDRARGITGSAKLYDRSLEKVV